MRIALATGVVLALCAASPAQSEPLSASDIEREIIGKRIYLAAPFGGEFPLNYLANGEVNGDGQALGLGRFMQPRDRGRWWIDADRLCQQFETWYDGEPMCFNLTWIGPDQVQWIRNNGETGTARIEG